MVHYTNETKFLKCDTIVLTLKQKEESQKIKFGNEERDGVKCIKDYTMR